MALPLINDGPPPAEGRSPIDDDIVNRAVASSGSVRALIGLLNQILSKRLKVHFAMATDQSQIEADKETFFFRFHTSPNGSRVRCRMVLSAGRYTVGAQPDPAINWAIRKLSPATTDTQDTIHNTHRDVNVGPANFRWIDQVWDLEGDTSYVAKLWQYDMCQLISCTVWEEPRKFLSKADGAVDVAVGLAGIAERHPIYDVNMQELWECYRLAFDRMGTVHFAWSQGTSGDFANKTSATLSNIFDVALTAYGADNPGFPCLAADDNHATLDSDAFGVLCWAIVSTNTAASFTGGQIQFRDSVGTIATIYIRPGQLASDDLKYAMAVSARWDAGAGTSKVDVLFASDGTRTLRIHACGLYDHEPLDPRRIAGLLAWYDASRITGLADNDPVAQWDDSSGNGHHAVQATAGNRPEYLAASLAGGKPAVRFQDGTADFMTVPDAAAYKQATLTVFVVAVDTGSAPTGSIIGYPHDGSDTTWRWALSFGTTGAAMVPAANATTYSTAATVTRFRAWTWTSSTNVLRSDGSDINNAADVAAITYPTAVGLYIGGNSAGSAYLDGDIAEILIYSGTLADADKYAIELYLREKYGIREVSAL